MTDLLTLGQSTRETGIFKGAMPSLTATLRVRIKLTTQTRYERKYI